MHFVAGDFNSNRIWGKHTRNWNHTDVVRQMNDINMVSLYHRHYGCEQGSEEHPTYFMYRREYRPYHIDYVFVSENKYDLEKAHIEIWSDSKWLSASDHLPLLASL
jgi:endonuclease/exonuclease/phosphatase family metal-dependent hydrolase